MTEGELKKRIRNKAYDVVAEETQEYSGADDYLALNDVFEVLDEAEQEYLAIPKKVEEAMKTNFIGSYADIKPFFELEWFKKWFGEGGVDK